MNNVINKFLLAGDKFMPEMHLRQPRFVYSACGPFTRHKERIKEFKRTGDTRYIYRNELDACFQHDSAYADHKDLINRTEADKFLRDKAYDIATNPKCDGYQRGLASMVYKFFDKKSTGSDFKKLKNTAEPSTLVRSSSILADERHKPIFNAFNKIIKQSNRKPNKIWVDQGGEFYNNVFEKWLSDNDINMYSTYNEGKSVVAERFIRTLKNKLYKHMTATGRNVYYDVLDDVVNKYNNTKDSTIKMKPIDVKNSKRVFIDEHNQKDSKFKVGDRVRISRYKNIFAKGYAPNWSSEIFIVDKITKTDLKNITHVDVSSFASKTNLAALKTEVDKIDANKLKTAPTDLAKLNCY